MGNIVPELVIVVECQRGVIGDLSPFGALVADAERFGVLDNIRLVIAAAETARIPVVHCTFTHDVSTPTNAPLLAYTARRFPIHPNSPEAEIATGLHTSTSLTVERHHGVSAIGGTEMESVIKGINGAIVVGASLNAGVLGTVIELVNAGKSVWVGTDAVVAASDAVRSVVTQEILPQLCEVMATRDLVALLAAR